MHVSRKKIYNVIYMLRDQETCPDLSKFPDNSFDFVLINGTHRTNCVQNVLSKVKPGGWVYLDNTEMKSRTKVGNDYQQAEQLSPSFTLPGKGLVKYFTGFVSTNFVAKQELHVNLSLIDAAHS